MITSRRCGILLHPTSLPGSGLSGTLGQVAHRFIQLLADAGVSLWQILPLNPPGYGYSPYQCYSAFAGNPLLIDLKSLVPENLLEEDDIPENPVLDRADRVDFHAAEVVLYRLLRRAFQRFRDQDRDKSDEYRKFKISSETWLKDYCIFMALKNLNGNTPWYEWEEGQRCGPGNLSEDLVRRISPETEFQEFLQYVFFVQWKNLKKYANDRGIRIIGDIPIFIAGDSADAWANPELLKLDTRGTPRVVAGVPPDYFSKTGQRWGNPVYAWKIHRKHQYAWWIRRFQTTLEQVDIIRLDHFRGFEKYWEIPAKESTAVNGKWVPGPGAHFFKTVRDKLGPIPIIAEDLGVITPEVVRLRDGFSFPGMKILQFAFGGDADNPYLPHNYTQNSVVYTGTHDNNTIRGWIMTNPDQQPELDHVHTYLGFSPDSISEAMIRMALQSVAGWAVIPMQDILDLDSCARMNFPGKSQGNWCWRMTSLDDFETRIPALKSWIKMYGRMMPETGNPI